MKTACPIHHRNPARWLASCLAGLLLTTLSASAGVTVTSSLPEDMGAEEVRHTFQYSEDGLTFAKMMSSPKRFPQGAGTYRPEAFTDSGKGKMIQWGVDIRGRKGVLPSIERFDCEWKNK